MIIRNVVKNDVENIAKLYISNWKETYKDLLSKDFLESLNEEHATNKWFKYIEEGNSIFVVYDEEEFLGFVASKKDDDIENCWYLDSLHINKACRGKGIGTKLIKKVGQYAMHQGYEHMSICIVKGNDMLRIYMKGWEQFIIKILLMILEVLSQILKSLYGRI